MKLHIESFFHCGKCIDEKPNDKSPKEWSQIGCGWTKKGFQVWCNRHDLNIVHLDFMGQKIGYAEEEEKNVH